MQQEVCLSSNKQTTHPGFFKTREKTEDWLDSMRIKNYTINDDLSVDGDLSVDIDSRNLDYIPVQFRLVCGRFDCSNNNLTSLEGCPTEVGLDFFCYKNNLISLEHCPKEVGRFFSCSFNNLTSLEYCPNKAFDYFSCNNNNLTSLKGCPVELDGSFNCSYNNLTSLEHCPTKVDGSFDCSHNNLTSFKGCPKEIGDVLFCNNNNLTSLEHCPTKVGGGGFYCFYNMIVTEMSKDYYTGDDNPSWETDDPELISSRFFDRFEGLDIDTKMRALADLKKLEPEFYNSEAFQVYNPDSMLGRIKRSREVTGGLFEL